MEMPEALELIRKAIQEIPRLKQLNRKNDEFPLWQQKLKDVLEAVFGKDSTEYFRFVWAVTSYSAGSEEYLQKEYVEHLGKYEVALKSILQKYELLGIPAKTTVVARGKPLQVFIAHGEPSESLRKLCEFLEALGAQPLVVEKMASEGRSVDGNVGWCLDQADCAIILATKGDIDSKTEDFIPRGNILIEEGRCQERLPGRIVYLLEEGVRFPSNIAEKVWQRFTQDNMEIAFIKTARELAAFGLLKAMKGD